MDLGQRLLPVTLDWIAHKNPSHTWAVVQKPGSSDFEDIPIYTFANAVNRAAAFVERTLGKPSNHAKTAVAYIGLSDLRYYVMLLAIVKAGYVPLLPSHLNSKVANDSLCQKTNCGRLLCGLPSGSQVAMTLDGFSVNMVPSQEELWDPMPVEAYEFTRNFAEACADPLVIIHTSGSSGMPKPVTYTHGSFATSDPRNAVPDHDGHQTIEHFRQDTQRFYVSLPPFHGAGLTAGLLDSIFNEATLIFQPPDKPMNAKTFCEVVDRADADSAALLPHVLEDIARTPEALERVERLKFVIWIGGPISQVTGDAISTRTELLNCYASTELGASHQLLPARPSLWPYFHFHPTANAFDFRPVPSTGETPLYELFVKRDPALQQQVFRIFPELDEWPMKDLFTPHPTEPNHWLFAGRSDDLIIFADGTKLNPRCGESLLKAAPGVRDALLLGTGRTRAAAIVEISDANETADNQLISSIWPTVEQWNIIATPQGKLIRELVMATKKDKPFPRTGKRTIQRSAALELYQRDIEEMYAALAEHLKWPGDFRIGSGGGR